MGVLRTCRPWIPSLPSSRAAGYFCSVKNQPEHFGTARLVQERVSSDCLLLHLCLALKIPKYGNWLGRIQAVAQWLGAKEEFHWSQVRACLENKN